MGCEASGILWNVVGLGSYSNRHHEGPRRVDLQDKEDEDNWG